MPPNGGGGIETSKLYGISTCVETVLYPFYLKRVWNSKDYLLKPRSSNFILVCRYLFRISRWRSRGRVLRSWGQGKSHLNVTKYTHAKPAEHHSPCDACCYLASVSKILTIPVLFLYNELRLIQKLKTAVCKTIKAPVIGVSFNAPRSHPTAIFRVTSCIRRANRNRNKHYSVRKVNQTIARCRLRVRKTISFIVSPCMWNPTPDVKREQAVDEPNYRRRRDV